MEQQERDEIIKFFKTSLQNTIKHNDLLNKHALRSYSQYESAVMKSDGEAVVFRFSISSKKGVGDE